MIRKYKSQGAVAAAIIALTALSGCGADATSGSPNGSAGASNGLSGKPLVVASLPVGDLLLPYLAQDQGLFKKEGIEVKIQSAPGGGQAQLPLVLNGEYDLAIAGAGDVVKLAAGSPVVAVAGAGSISEGDPKKATQMVVAKDNDIKSPRDLEGRTVGLNSIGSQTEYSIRQLVKDDGGDPSKVQFVQIPTQNIPAAVQSGQLAAGSTNEPYLSQADKLGLHQVFSPDKAVDGLPLATYFTTATEAKSRAGDLNAFVRAMQAAAVMANKNPELIRDLVKKYTKTDPALVDKMTHFPQFTEKTSVDPYAAYASFAVKSGFIATAPPVKDWVYVPSS